MRILVQLNAGNFQTPCFMRAYELVCRCRPKRFDVVANTSKCFHQNLTLLLLSRSAKVEFAKSRDYKTWNMGFPSQDESPALTVLLYSIWTNHKSSRTTRSSEQNIKLSLRNNSEMPSYNNFWKTLKNKSCIIIRLLNTKKFPYHLWKN